jgi:hypothetical protein
MFDGTIYLVVIHDRAVSTLHDVGEIEMGTRQDGRLVGVTAAQARTDQNGDGVLARSRNGLTRLSWHHPMVIDQSGNPIVALQRTDREDVSLAVDARFSLIT